MCKITTAQVNKIIESYERDPQQLIAILLDIQSASEQNYVDKEWAEIVSRELDIPLSKIYEALTFYSMFSITPRGKYIIELCYSTPCYFLKGRELQDWVEAAAGIKLGETSADRKITLQRTNCVGACDTGPVIKIGDEVFGNLTKEKVSELIACCRKGQLNV